MFSGGLIIFHLQYEVEKGGGSPLFFQEKLYFKDKPIFKDDTLRGHMSVLASPVLLHQKFCLKDG